MKLELTASKYRKFLIEFRAEDIKNAATAAETVVEYDTSKYYFESPNFKLVAYDVGAGRVNLTDYNHHNLPKAKSLSGLKSDLGAGGGGSTKMNTSLSTIVAAISEAARSKVVEAAFQKMIAGTSIDLSRYEVLFKAYNQPARYNGFLGQDGAYKTSWRALKKQDYLHFFNSMEYTGDSSKMRIAVSGL